MFPILSHIYHRCLPFCLIFTILSHIYKFVIILSHIYHFCLIFTKLSHIYHFCLTFATFSVKIFTNVSYLPFCLTFTFLRLTFTTFCLTDLTLTLIRTLQNFDGGKYWTTHFWIGSDHFQRLGLGHDESCNNGLSTCIGFRFPTLNVLDLIPLKSIWWW